MNRILQTVVLVILFPLLSLSQQASTPDDELKVNFTKASSLMADDNYSAALAVWLKLDSLFPQNHNILFQIGVCYLKLPIENAKAIPYFRRATENVSPIYQDGYYKEANAPMESLQLLAEAYHLLYEFDSAVAIYNRYKSILHPSQTKKISEVDRMIEISATAIELMKNPVNMTVTNLGPKINSVYPEYAALLTADESTIFFTSKRQSNVGGKISEDGKYYEDIYVADKYNGEWMEPINISAPINTDEHEATVGLSPDGQQLFIYKYEKLLGFGDIFSSELTGNKWTVPQRLGGNINSPSQELHASVSADGQLIFFTSNREGGFGGTDIYFSKKLPTGEWGIAQNTGPSINTPYDEDAPYIHPDGVTFFFSSKGHKNMGGFDIFFSEKNKKDDTWEQPINMGYPVNSTADDVFFIPSADGTRAYFSTVKKDGYGDQDIYLITFPDQREIPVTVYTGIVKDELGNVPNEVQIIVTDNETGQIVGNYTPNAKTGKYLFILQPGKNYNITYESESHLFHSENLAVPYKSAYKKINKPVELIPIVVGATIKLNNLNFEFNSTEKLLPESHIELEKVKELLTKNPGIKIEISGHTDSKGSEKVNLDYSQRRCQTVVNYLIKNGIDSKRMIAKGYGLSKPIAPNVNPDGSDNPVGRALNRRIELKILEVN